MYLKSTQHKGEVFKTICLFKSWPWLFTDLELQDALSESPFHQQGCQPHTCTLPHPRMTLWLTNRYSFLSSKIYWQIEMTWSEIKTSSQISFNIFSTLHNNIASKKSQLWICIIGSIDFKTRYNLIVHINLLYYQVNMTYLRNTRFPGASIYMFWELRSSSFWLFLYQCTCKPKWKVETLTNQ